VARAPRVQVPVVQGETEGPLGLVAQSRRLEDNDGLPQALFLEQVFLLEVGL